MCHQERSNLSTFRACGIHLFWTQFFAIFPASDQLQKLAFLAGNFVHSYSRGRPVPQSPQISQQKLGGNNAPKYKNAVLPRIVPAFKQGQGPLQKLACSGKIHPFAADFQRASSRMTKDFSLSTPIATLKVVMPLLRSVI